MYKIFNAVINSKLPLPELPRITQKEPLATAIFFKLHDQPLTLPGKFHSFDHLYSDEAKTRLVVATSRYDGCYLVQFPDMADFMLDFRRNTVHCHPSAGTPVETIRHLLLDQVLPRYMGHQGNLILHASAVVLPGGTGIIFLGKSGWGKSTIASSFHQDGARLVTDDTLLLEEKDGHLVGIPAYAGSRLWQDSADSIFPDYTDLAAVSHYSDKKRLILHGEADALTEIEVNAIFLLSDPEQAESPEGITIKPVHGADAIMAMIRRGFLLDAEDMGVVGRQFSSASRVASTNPAVFSLSYPHEYDKLAELREAILDVVNF